MNDELFVALQRISPQQGLSKIAGKIASSESTWVKNRFISWFHKQYQPNMAEAEQEDPLAYASFNDFFTRKLKAGARPLPEAPKAFACPADGKISQLGSIEQGRIVQAKGQSFTSLELLGGNEEQAKSVVDGQFLTVYLSPKDYHRVHMPIAGDLVSMTHIPGRLFSVNPATTEHLPRLFARNERVVCEFSTANGPVFMVLVGAMIVGSIATTWAGVVNPRSPKIKREEYPKQVARFERGDEMGRFLLGSTVVVLCGADQLSWDSATSAGQEVKMGQALGGWK